MIYAKIILPKREHDAGFCWSEVCMREMAEEVIDMDIAYDMFIDLVPTPVIDYMWTNEGLIGNNN